MKSMFNIVIGPVAFFLLCFYINIYRHTTILNENNVRNKNGLLLCKITSCLLKIIVVATNKNIKTTQIQKKNPKIFKHPTNCFVGGQF